MATIPSKKPTSRKVSMRGLVYAISGREPDYDAYRFGGGHRKYERPKHNPFYGLRDIIAFRSTGFTTGFR